MPARLPEPARLEIASLSDYTSLKRPVSPAPANDLASTGVVWRYSLAQRRLGIGFCRARSWPVLLSAPRHPRRAVDTHALEYHMWRNQARLRGRTGLHGEQVPAFIRASGDQGTRAQESHHVGAKHDLPGARRAPHRLLRGLSRAQGARRRGHRQHGRGQHLRRLEPHPAHRARRQEPQHIWRDRLGHQAAWRAGIGRARARRTQRAR